MKMLFYKTKSSHFKLKKEENMSVREGKREESIRTWWRRKGNEEEDREENHLLIVPHGNTPPPSLCLTGFDWQPPTPYTQIHLRTHSGD